MKTPNTILKYIAAAILVIILGGLAGWYVFVNKQITANDIANSARGFGITSTFGGNLGSSYDNAYSGSIGDIPSTASTDEGRRAPRLWQITRTPVAGLGFMSSSSSLYFAERASGNVLLANPLTSLTTRLTNTLFAKITDAVFARDGSVVLRSVSQNNVTTSFAGRIASSTSPVENDTPSKLEGVYLPQNIVTLAAHSNPNELFFVVPDPSGGASGVTSTWGGTGQKRIFSSALSGWIVMSLSDGSRYIQQKPSNGVSGYAFKILSNGALERVARDLPGLEILPKSRSSALLYSSALGSDISLFGRINAQSADTRIPLRTIAEKCVWAPGISLIAYCAVPQTAPQSPYPDSWFMGDAHTADAWWKIDVSANSVEQIFTPDVNTALDVESPAIDDSGRYIAFINGSDKTLWMLTIEK